MPYLSVYFYTFEQIDPSNLEDIKNLSNHDIFGVRVNIDPTTSSFDIVFSTKALILEVLQGRWSLGDNFSMDWTYGVRPFCRIT